MPKAILKNVVERIKDKVDKDNTDLEYYIGGEHFDNGEIQISRKGIIAGSTIGPAFHMRFMPGDVLLMSRNPHLRKASVVDFEGICSDVSYVCRTKDESVLMQKYLPFIFQTDHFWKFAEENKKGSTNFFLNWSDFEKYEFNLPSIEEQKKLVDLLWSFQETKSAYKVMLEKTDEMVKSQFIELFENGKYPLSRAQVFIRSMRNGVSPSKKGTVLNQILTLSAITQGDFDESAVKEGLFEVEPAEEKRVSEEDFYLCRGNGNKCLVGLGAFPYKSIPDLVFPDTMIALKIDETIIRKKFIETAWKLPSVREQIESAARTTNGTYKINQKIINDVRVVIPPIENQDAFVSFVEQSDKSKFELKQGISDMDALMKAFMAQVNAES